MKVLVIVPAYNEAGVIAGVVAGIRKVKGINLVLVVDDGSSDRTGELAEKAGARVLRHTLNRGLGGAIGTGLAYAKNYKFDVAVTIDADGQHDPRDIRRVIGPIVENKADVVIGTRTKYAHEVPLDRRVMIKVSNWLTYLLFGFRTNDSLSGFRAFSRKALDNIHIKTQRMEVSNELFSQIKRNRLKYSEVPISVSYTEYSRSKGQTNMNALNVLTKLLLRLAR